MPTTENDRRNAQQPVLEHPSLPDHDRRRDAGMHAAIPLDLANGDGAADEVFGFDEDEALAPPDQEFGQILSSGLKASNGLIPDDPNNWMTSEPEKSGVADLDPEDRGESLPDLVEENPV